MTYEQLMVVNPSERFSSTVKLRFALWQTMIGETATDQEIKRQITEVLKKLKDEGLTAWDSLDQAFSDTIEALEAVKETWKANTSQPAVQNLFQNLKTDITELEQELLNPPA